MGDDSGEVNSNNIPPVAASSGLDAGIFAAAQNFIIANSQFFNVNGNHVQINNPSVATEVIAPLPPVRHSSTMFTGRSTYLQRLKDHFFPNAMEKRKSFLLHGLGGIGKTQICLKFTEENESLFSDIFWIDASSESAVDLRLKQIAQANNAPPEAASSAAHALKWISGKSNWLMIYDNADGGYQVVEKFLPPGNGGNILITSRNFELCRITEGSMEVFEMKEEEALSLLFKSARLNYTSEDVEILAKQLVSKLGGIPLAIDQAGAYMIACRCPLEDYLEIYAKNHGQLILNPSFKGASNYGSSTYETWEISMKEIEAQVTKGVNFGAVAAKSATILYRIIAFLHYENIPEELFKIAAKNYKNRDIDAEEKLGLPLSVTMLDPNVLFLDKKGDWDIMQFQLGTQVLLSFSLLKKIGKMYSIHPLVNSWNRSRIPEIEINRQISMTRAMLACSVELNYSVDNYKFCGLLAPHIRANYDHAVELGLSTVYYDDECVRFALVFDHIGSWKEAEKLEVQVMEARKEKLGSHHPDTLTSMGNLASTYRDQGKWDEAEKLEVQVMEARKETLGSHHLDTLASMANLAATYKDQGRWDEAEKLEVQVMGERIKKLGSHHPDTLRSMANLAVTYQNQGRWGKAEKLQVQVMMGSKAKLGVHHPDTLRSMANLAVTYKNQGRWDEAEKLEVQVMEVRKEKLGSHHPDTLRSMANLAGTYRNQGRWDEAEKLEVQVMEASKKRLGLHHPDTLTSMANLAVTYQNQGKWGKAEKLQVQVMDATKEKLGLAHHPDTLRSITNLASTYRNQGRWDEAEKLEVQVMEASKKKLGSHHPDTLTSMANLAATYWKQGRWNEAEKLEVQVMETSKEKLGSHHPDTLRSMANLAVTYQSQGRSDEAEKLKVQVMEASKEKFGSHHPDTLRSMANLAVTYQSQGRLDEADVLLAQAIMLMAENMGSQHPTTIHYRNIRLNLLEAST
ncbi:hypothetical protein F5887DRAFT_1278053 [Amanita rubescens]|nr:hypothetical protein F5887DRAFT_1278053 [Amanita rubescens]